MLGDLPMQETVSKSFVDAGVPLDQILNLFRSGAAGAMSDSWRESPWAYICIQKIARTMAQVPLRIYASDDDDAEVVTEGRLFQLLKKPNPVMHLPRLVKQIVMHRLTRGGTWLILLDDMARPLQETRRGEIPVPSQVYPIREDMVQLGPIVRGTGVPRDVTFDIAGGHGQSNTMTVPWHSVAHVYDADVTDYMRGTGPAMVGARRHQIDRSIEHFDQELLTNKGRIPGVLESDFGVLLPDQQGQAEASVNEELRRDDPDAVALPGGMRWKTIAHSPKDMNVVELRRWNRDLSLALFGVTKPVVSIVEDVNRANAEAAESVFYSTTMQPLGVEIENDLTFALTSRLAEHPEYVLRFDWTGIEALSEDDDSKIKRAKGLVEMGVPPRSALITVGYSLSEDALAALEDDQRYIGGGLRPLVDAVAGAPMEPEPEQDEDEEESEPEKTAKAVEPEPEVRRGYTPEQRKLLRDAHRKSVVQNENRVKARALPVLQRFVDAHLDRIRAVAAGAKDAHPALAKLAAETLPRGGGPWHVYSRLGHDDDGKRIDPYVSKDEPAEWLEMRAISDDELRRLLVQNKRQWGSQLWDAVLPPLNEAAAEGILDMASLIGGPATTSVTDPSVIEAILSKKIKVVEGPMSTVAEQIKRRIASVMAGDPTEPGQSLAQRLSSVLEELEGELADLRMGLGSRAQLIAQTETNSAMQSGRMAEMEAAESISEHEWLTERDGEVRPGHQIDGEVRKLGEPFSNGLKQPGDPESNDAGEVANCRCSTLPVIDA